MAHVATLTIDHTKVAADLTDFPVAVIANGDAGWAELYAVATEGGGDIRVFKSDDVTELPREIVSFSVSAETGEIHIKYTGTLSSSVDTDIHIYADGVSSDYAVGATYGRNAVWSGYEFVSHNGGGTDSTGNHTVTANGGVSAGDTTGQIGSATTFDGTADYFKTDNINLSTSQASMSAWIRQNTTSTEMRPWSVGKTTAEGGSGEEVYGNIFSPQENGSFGLRGISSPVSITKRILTNYTSFNANTTYLLHQTFGSKTLRVYLNGTQAVSGSNANAALSSNNLFLYIGARPDGNSILSYWDGWIGEFRWYDGTLSADWITTEYNNQNSPSTFYAVTAAGGAVEQALTATVDALIKQPETASHTINAYVFTDNMLAVSIDALVRDTQEADHSADALVSELLSVTQSLNALISETLSASQSADALVSARAQVQHSVDALLSEKLTASGSVDALISALESHTVAVDALVSVREALSHTLDTWIELQQTVAHSADSLVSVRETGTHSIDAYVLVPIDEVECTIDAYVNVGVIYPYAKKAHFPYAKKAHLPYHDVLPNSEVV